MRKKIYSIIAGLSVWVLACVAVEAVFHAGFSTPWIMGFGYIAAGASLAIKDWVERL